MGLTLTERRAATETTAIRYSLANKWTKGIVLDELCATTDWYRSHARKALKAALQPKSGGTETTWPDKDSRAAAAACPRRAGQLPGRRLPLRSMHGPTIDAVDVARAIIDRVGALAAPAVTPDVRATVGRR